jgi:hypothetical protein
MTQVQKSPYWLRLPEPEEGYEAFQKNWMDAFMKAQTVDDLPEDYQTLIAISLETLKIQQELGTDDPQVAVNEWHDRLLRNGTTVAVDPDANVPDVDLDL